jgi:hypothetical protein
MISGATFTKIALSFPGAETTPHFNRSGFKVTGRRMFATYLSEDNTANIFLTPAEQSVFCEMDKENVYPVPNKWGQKGATTFNLNKIDMEILQEALLSAYKAVVSSKQKG